MIVDSRDALLLGGGGDGGSMSSPLNLAFFYGASPHSSEGSCSPAHSAPGSPGSDSELSSSGGSSSSGDFSKRRLPRSGAQSARQGSPRPLAGSFQTPAQPCLGRRDLSDASNSGCFNSALSLLPRAGALAEIAAPALDAWMEAALLQKCGTFSCRVHLSKEALYARL